MQTLTPHVYWAQRHGEIYLRVELSDAQNLTIRVEENTLTFRGQGHGAKGENDYEFSLEFLKPVKPEVSHRSTQRQVNITVRKQEHDWWDRLTNLRLFLLLPFFLTDSFYDTFHTIADMMFFCQLLAVLEVMNPAVGLVKTGIVPPMIQVFGRNFILFIILGSLDDMQNKPVVFFVFYLWSSIEIVRYPFYMLACIDTKWKLLTWLRYTIWIPLYPLGVIAEAVAVIQSMPIFDETKLLSIPLPKGLGSRLSFSYVLHLYLVLMFLGLFLNFRHLYKQRRKQLRTKKRKPY
ncbi:very-long-chain (3R)-3-hydroxyacyl-CoA dehydratase [Alosa alosa]|uniref:very-long-chain (3R)-3-hydroxyacyl-CoA dehydratase n=1 Tax=Alosa alosa TaxID=278164 RepID=UPI0020153E72|nr:very-long-chain (3R)-3-hydroxyacyl-CoA dehydratase [Alosa alosa]